MDLKTKAALSALALIASMQGAQARNDKLIEPVQPVLNQGATRQLIGSFNVRFGSASAAGYDIISSGVEAKGSVDPYRPTGNGPRVKQPDDEVCRYAFRQAVAELVNKARKAGGTALVGVVSNYDHVENDSPDNYECHVGMSKAVVVLKGSIARGGPAPGAAQSAAASSSPVATEHVYRVPAATGYAQAQEVDKVPLEQKGRERYAHYLTLQPPKAFVVYENGAWRFWAHDGEAMSKALNYCAREGKTCWLYAVDDHVVWSPDPAQRIGRIDQLQAK
jgi:hypothetical protein